MQILKFQLSPCHYWTNLLKVMVTQLGYQELNRVVIFTFFTKLKLFLHVRSHGVQKKRHAIAEDKFDFSKEGGPLSLTSYVTGI